MDNRKIIYLDDAIDAVLKLTYADGAYGYADAKDLVDSLENLPPAQPERKVSARKGLWVKHDTGHSTYFDCSLCSCLAPCTETEDKFIWKLSNYCPDCGAKMINARGEQDELDS